jgi:hypothetical protein
MLHTDCVVLGSMPTVLSGRVLLSRPAPACTDSSNNSTCHTNSVNNDGERVSLFVRRSLRGLFNIK